MFLGDCFLPTTFSVFAVNTIDGAKLIYKHSSSATEGTVLFEGHNISSSNGCGKKSQRCIVRLLSWDSISLAALPLEDHFGLVTFNNESAQNRFAFREKHIVSTNNLNLDCDLISIFDYPPTAPEPTLLAVCISEDSDTTLLDVIFVTLDLANLTSSDPPFVLTPACPVTNTSNFIFFDSPTFFSGVVVFVDRGLPMFQRISDSEDCEPDDDLQVCLNVERFVPISKLHQAIYCSSQVYLLDLARDVTFPTFSPSADGVLMFCSSDIYCAYANNSLTLHQVSDKAALQNPVEFPYQNDVVSGDCVVADGEFFVVVRLRNSTVIAVNLNQSSVVNLGVSAIPPRLFQHSVLLENSTHTIVFNLQQSIILDQVVGRFPLGAVHNGASIPIPCNISTESTTTASTTTTALASSFPVYGIALTAGCGGISVLAVVIIGVV